MVKVSALRTSNTTLVQSQSLVTVFVGGTSGIGHYTLRAFATAAATGNKPFRAYIVGRNAKGTEDNIAECRGICPHGEFKFVKAEDLSLIQDVDRVCAEIIRLEGQESKDVKIDYLMMCQGGSIFLPRIGTFKYSDVVALLTIIQIRKKELTKQCP
jgi:NAD(P)-dependent dehydrogenase (short-subunit alcohol dehydrogenase family)